MTAEVNRSRVRARSVRRVGREFSQGRGEARGCHLHAGKFMSEPAVQTYQTRSGPMLALRSDVYITRSLELYGEYGPPNGACSSSSSVRA
jgi:hypothetical protein